MPSDAAFIGTIPQHYDRGLGPVIFFDAAEDIARRVAAFRPARVLETAAGTGIVTRRLRDALPADAELVATDLNPPMLEVARQKFTTGENVIFQQADATALPFGDNSFDAVVCQFGVMFFPDKDKGYREVLRVLRPGGHYVFNVWDSHKYNLFGRISHGLFQELFPSDPPQFQKVPFSYPFEPIKDSLVDAGFAEINVAVLQIRKTIADMGEFARGIVYGSPVIDQIRARGGVEPETIVARMIAALEAEFGTNPSVMNLQGLVFSAQKPA